MSDLAPGLNWVPLGQLLVDGRVIIAFCYSDIPTALADRAKRTPNLQAVAPNEAIIGGIHGEWATPPDALAGVWENDAFVLGDFARLSAYLARSTDPEPGFAPVPNPPA